jgi:hypothetical protein
MRNHDDELDPETRRKVDELKEGINELFANKTLNIIMTALLEMTAFAFAAMSDQDRHLDEYINLLRMSVEITKDQTEKFPRKQ